MLIDRNHFPWSGTDQGKLILAQSQLFDGWDRRFDHSVGNRSFAHLEVQFRSVVWGQRNRLVQTHGRRAVRSQPPG